MGAGHRARRLMRPIVDQYALRRCDVVVVSFPKAGRTWLRMLIGQAFAAHFDLSARPVDDILAVTPLARGRRDVPRVLFTHDGNPQGSTPREIVGRSKKAYRHTKVVFLVRDPRDVIVSLFFQKSRRKGLQSQAGVDASMGSFIRAERGGLESVVAFYRLWFDHRSVPRGFLVVRYEDLHKDPHETLRRVVEFTGVSGIESSAISQAVEASRFDTMRHLEASGALSAEALTPGDAGDEESFKTRRGEVGGYRDYLSTLDQEWMDQSLRSLPGEFGYGALP